MDEAIKNPAINFDQNEQVLMARQPIYDCRSKIVAYELLFRQFDNKTAEVIDADNATSVVLVNAFTHLDINELIGTKKAFINFTRNLLANPPPFDKDRLVIEVLEDVEIDDSLVRDLTALSMDGYTIALDDFIMQESSDRVLAIADIVKIDLIQLSVAELHEYVRVLKQYDLTLLAEKVETHEEYELCASLGFELFQGYFLCKPQTISGKQVPPAKLVVMELIGKLQDPSIKFSDLDLLISRDPILSFKILKLVNSAAYLRVAKLDSISSAISYLGMEQIRSLAGLLLLSNLNDKPSALKNQTMIRAKMCELIGKNIDPDYPCRFFSAGLLSTLDAYFDQTLESILESLPLHEDLCDALLHHKGDCGIVLQSVLKQESADWNQINWDFLASHGITPSKFNDYYQRAIAWQEQTITD
jgi:EAL and modified HD-GYP domain-containing signal transduction protein